MTVTTLILIGGKCLVTFEEREKDFVHVSMMERRSMMHADK